MGIYIVIRQYWNIGISCIIESLPQQSSIMGQTQSPMYFPIPTAACSTSYFPLRRAARASPMTICAGKQMSLCTYFFPRRMASSLPTSNGTARIPWVERAADITRQKAWEVLGTSTIFFFPAFFCKFYRIRIGQYTVSWCAQRL